MKKVALITGASSGIGEVTAHKFLKAGLIVYGGARRVEKMKGIEKAGANILALDLTVDESMEKVVNQIIEEQGKIDILINNAGYGSYGALEDVPIAEAKRQFEVNVFGLMRLTQLVLPGMRTQESGKIINITSVGGKMFSPIGGWYHATKHAVEVLSDVLRNEVSQFGIDVIVIEPGGVNTEWAGIAQKSALKYSEHSAYSKMAKIVATMDSNNTIQFIEPEDIADTIYRSISAKNPKTRYVKGKGVKPLLFLKWLLPDKRFDKILQSYMKRMEGSK